MTDYNVYQGLWFSLQIALAALLSGASKVGLDLDRYLVELTIWQSASAYSTDHTSSAVNFFDAW